jgi:UDP-3-O-[3-hydroxymyristoyl] glucosamine N-acyltransferase
MPLLEITAQELADRLEGVLRHCPPERMLSDILPLDQATGHSLSFLANPKYRAKALESGAGLILATPEDDLGDRPQLLMQAPYRGFAEAIGFFHPEPPAETCADPIHPTAVLGAGVILGPGCTLGARTVLGAGVRLHAGVHVEEDCTLGDGCELFPGVVLYRGTQLGRQVRVHGNTVLGSDGFGYVSSKAGHQKIPQMGWVEVGDDVEIGAGVTVDRGVLGPTLIGRGTKIDNLCQIAHNVEIGEHCLIVSQVGISGSTTLGKFVTLAGKVGVIGHLRIGDHTVVSGNSMVAKDLPPGSFVSGYLARPHREWMESQAALNRLPAFMKSLRKKPNA